MGFNFGNLLQTINQFNQFKNQFLSSGKDPKQALINEISRRGITPNQLADLITQAKQLSNLLGLK